MRLPADLDGDAQLELLHPYADLNQGGNDNKSFSQGVSNCLSHSGGRDFHPILRFPVSAGLATAVQGYSERAGQPSPPHSDVSDSDLAPDLLCAGGGSQRSGYLLQSEGFSSGRRQR